MKLLLIIAAFAAVLALTWGRGCCGGCSRGYDDEDYVPSCGRGYHRHESDSRHGHRGHHEGESGCGGKDKTKHQKDDDDDVEETKDTKVEAEDNRVYKFQLGDNLGAYEYIDDEGYLKGFYVDLLMAVCEKAGKKCAYLLDSYENCWKTSGENEYPGVGMLDGWYDGCLGMLPSPDRLNSFNFTAAFTQNVQAALYWRENEEMGDKSNITNRSIGFIEGWAVNQRCLKRQDNITGTDSFIPVMFKTYKALVSALLNKQVDAIYSVDILDTTKGIVPQEPWFQCTLRGMSVMTQYYSEVTGWWNKAFAELQSSGEFKELCEKSQETHGQRGKISCI